MFISAPMSVVSTDKFGDFRADILKMISYFQLEFPHLDIHYSGTNISNSSNFDTPYNSFNHDIEALEKTNLFFLLYPERSASSALIELGYALKMKIPIIIVTPKREELPYMVIELDKALDNAYIFEYENSEFYNYVAESSKILDIIKGSL